MADDDGIPIPHVRIVNTDGRGFKTQVYIGDQDVSGSFRSVKLSVDVKDMVIAELEPVICEVDVVGDLSELRMPSEGTRELLIRHGWTPPAEPKAVPMMVRRAGLYEELDRELFTCDGPLSGRELVDRFFDRVQCEWEPSEGDTLTVGRAYDEKGNPIPGKRTYSLTLTMDGDRAEESATS